MNLASFKLSERDRAILVTTQFDAFQSAVTVAKRLKVKSHAVHYSLNSLREKGIIRPVALINPFALGLQQFGVFFSLAPHSQDSPQRVLTELAAHPAVAWLAELGGRYQYGFTYCCRSIFDFSNFLEQLATRFGDIFFEKTILTNLSFTLFRKRYLSNTKPENDCLIQGGKAEGRESLDEIDMAVLKAYASDGVRSQQHTARALGIPRSTVQYRVQKLESSGIIQNYIHLISARKLGYEVYRLLVHARGFSQQLKDSLFEFARNEDSVVNFIHCIGDWDFEMTVEVAQSSEITALIQRLNRTHGTHIHRTEILTIFKQSQSVQYLGGALETSKSQ